MFAIRARAAEHAARSPTVEVYALQPARGVAAWQINRVDSALEVSGDLGVRDGAAIWSTLHALATARPAKVLDLDLGRATTVDGSVMALLIELRASLVGRGVRCEFLGATGHVRELVHLYRGDQPVLAGARAGRGPGPVERLGQATEHLGAYARTMIGFFGEVAGAARRALRKPSIVDWRSLPSLITRAGTDGVPIMMVLNFLVGFVLAYQSSALLETYGANIFVADIVGISITRELGPLMAAVIMSGRSGAAFAAELGTMRVSEEIDALRTMGFSPVPYLVLPRMIALAIAAPVLALLADIMGVFGGLVVGITSLDLTAHGYIAELRTAIVASDVWTGLVKSVGFGLAIAFIGCQQGLSARGAASGVGRSTTATVVYCLFTIVVLDTLFTIFFRTFDL